MFENKFPRPMFRQKGDDGSGSLSESVELAKQQVEDQMASVTEADGELKIGKITVHLKDAFPLTIGDWRALEKKGLMNAAGNVEIAGADHTFTLIFHLVKKINKEIREKDLENVSLKSLGRVFLYLKKCIRDEESSELDPTTSSS